MHSLENVLDKKKHKTFPEYFWKWFSSYMQPQLKLDSNIADKINKGEW